jgi:RNA polymerase sigma-70 factor (ECF subfamily)
VPPAAILRKGSPVSRFPQERLGDAELVLAIAAGDADAVGVVWDRYSAFVRSVLRANLGPDSDVEDLLQEVFIAFLKGVGTVRNASALRPYLASIAVRLVFGELRRRKVRRWITLTADGEVPAIPAAPRDVESKLVLGALYRLLEGMPRQRRVAFALRHVQGLEITDVARALAVSESTAKREIARARTAILLRAERQEPALWEYLQERSLLEPRESREPRGWDHGGGDHD